MSSAEALLPCCPMLPPGTGSRGKGAHGSGLLGSAPCTSSAPDMCQGLSKCLTPPSSWGLSLPLVRHSVLSLRPANTTGTSPFLRVPPIPPAGAGAVATWLPSPPSLHCLQLTWNTTAGLILLKDRFRRVTGLKASASPCLGGCFCDCCLCERPSLL